MLLPTIDGEHGRIEVEDDLACRREHSRAEQVVEVKKRPQSILAKTQEETPERGCIGVALEAGQITEDTVAFENATGIDPSQSHEHGIEQGQDEFACGVAVVALREAHRPGERLAKFQPLEEVLDQEESAEVSEVLAGEGKSQIPRSLGRRKNSTPKVGIPCMRTTSPE